jgi:DnaJ-class molecular chaperone
MTDYYQTLGVDPSASQDEIKATYRKLAMKHHPDRTGGDDTKFKQIQEAYATVGDQQKRAEYDQQRMGGPQVRFHSGDFDPFEHMFGGVPPFGAQSPFADIFGRQRVRKNRDLNIQCQISLLDSYTGKQLEASYQLPSGRTQSVIIHVPPGVEHGATIRYQGLGDDSHPQLQRGDLNVTILVMPDAKFRREGNDLYTHLDISPIEAMIGCRKSVTSINGQNIAIDVRPGVETGVEYAVLGFGFTNVNNTMRGRLVAEIRIRTPEITDPALIEKLKLIDHEIKQR